jgi:hypothetical protein
MALHGDGNMDIRKSMITGPQNNIRGNDNMIADFDAATVRGVHLDVEINVDAVPDRNKALIISEEITTAKAGKIIPDEDILCRLDCPNVPTAKLPPQRLNLFE